jgi:hypothetical protein
MFFGVNSFAQYFTRDAGIRVGEGLFMTYRQFFDENEAIEAMAGFSNRGFRLVAMREYFRPVATHKTDNLKLIYGYGIHAGVTYTNRFRVLHRVYYQSWKWSPQFGVDGIVGLEYRMDELPFLINAAAQPYFEYSLNRYFQLKAFNFMVSFKYRF